MEMERYDNGLRFGKYEIIGSEIVYPVIDCDYDIDPEYVYTLLNKDNGEYEYHLHRTVKNMI